MSDIELKYLSKGRIDWKQSDEDNAKAYILSKLKEYDKASAFAKAYPGLERKAMKMGWWHELVIKRGWKPKILWDKMEREKALLLMTEIAKQYTNRSTFRKECSGVAQKAKKWGVYFKITAHMKKINLKKRKPISEKLTNRAEFINLCKRLDPEEPFLIEKINQMIAYYVLRSSKEEELKFLNRLNKKHFKKNYMVKIWDKPLEKIGKLYLSDGSKYAFSLIIKRALQHGLTIPINFNSKEHKQLMVQNMISFTCPLEPKTVSGLFTREAELITSKFHAIQYLLQKMGHFKLTNVTFKQLYDCIKEYYGFKSKKSIQDTRREIMTVINKAIRMGWLEKTFYFRDIPIMLAFFKHKKSKTLVEERPLVWYFFEAYRDWWKDLAKDGVSNRRNQLSAIFNLLPKIMPHQLTSEIYSEIHGRKKPIFTLMLLDGVVSSDLLLKDQEEFTSDEKIWKINDVILNFNRIKNPSVQKAVMTLSKLYIKFHKPSTINTWIAGGNYISEFLKKKQIKTLPELNNGKKHLLYRYVDNLGDNGAYGKARCLISTARALVHEFNKRNSSNGFIAADLHMPTEEYTPPKKPKDLEYPVFSDKEMNKILDYLNDIRKMALQERMWYTAIILQLLLALRPSEITYLTIDCIRRIGKIDEWLIVYNSEKQNAVKIISVSLMCGDRTDPFAKAIRKLVPELISEVIELTENIRKHVDNKDNNRLFIHNTISFQKKAICSISSEPLRKYWVKMKKLLDINPKITLHKARHTMATRLLRTGSDIAQVAEALGDDITTVQKNYIATMSKIETMSLPKGRLIGIIEDDVKEIEVLKYSKPKVLTAKEAALRDDLFKVCGGNCSVGQKAMHACLTFIMTKGGNGCKGCSSHVPTPDNLPFWKGELRSDYSNMQKNKNTPLFERYRLEYLRTENLVIILKELTDD